MSGTNPFDSDDDTEDVIAARRRAHNAAAPDPNASASNPFDTDDEDDPSPPPHAAADNAAAAAATGAAATNPFDFDVDFGKVQQRRERARAAKESQKEEAEKPFIHGMDASDDDNDHSKVTGTATAATSSSSSSRRPNVVTHRAKTTGDAPTAAAAQQGQQQRRGTKKNFFGRQSAAGRAFQDSVAGLGGISEFEEEGPRETCLTIGSRKIALWPYDDYHNVQKLYYEKLDEAQKSKGSGGGADGAGTDGAGHNDGGGIVDTASSIPIFSRPADPPDIPTAVQGLNLANFETKSEERSISLISTWLFDAGLIDELLVNGGMTSAFGSGGNASGGAGEAADSANKSVSSQEGGVEVGQHGFPIEGPTKMDKEIAKLRNSTKRQLALINARLNDGVAATGSEVAELVNAIIATKDDIGRLRELSTYVSNASDVEQSHQFLLVKYPKLKHAVNARRNLARCFRELDFFSQIPATCDRLREELHAGEWTEHEWSSLRSVCREHVELEIFLVEAEAGMKKRLEEEALEEEKQSSRGGGRSRASVRGAPQGSKNKFGRQALSNAGFSGALGGKNDLIDQFLEEHVSNVWELGDEIRLRIMSGVATAFDLAMNNPAGMVALVEAVEVYQTANDEYKAVHGVEAGRSQTLRFTDMRAAALGELFKDFESRSLEVIRELTTEAADIAEEEEASNQQFSAVLRAATDLTSEIGIVKEKMVPCFPPEWCIEILWTTCVAHVCSNNILQQIGGPEGHKLPDLTVTQLLDLVAWVENFREIIEETFPNIGSISAKRTYLDEAPKLLINNNKEVDLEAAADSLAWVNNTLWDVHDLAKDEFLFRTKEQTEEWLDNVYEADHTKNQTAEGRLITSLCEDVYALAGVQLRTIRERLTRRSEALVQAVGVIIKSLYERQIAGRDQFCPDLETCCAASNDFIRMSEQCETIVQEIQDECDLSPQATETMEEQAAALLGLYSNDAVYAAQKTHIYIFEPIEEAVKDEIFGPDWLNNLTHNELALTVVRTLDDFMEDLETFLDEVMVQKCVEAQISASVNFYIRSLLLKADEHNSGRASYFTDNVKAIKRMRDDIAVMREYFEGLAESMPTLSRAIESEFGVLETFVELVSIAGGVSQSDAHDFILLLQKKVKNIQITKFVVGDLYHLVKPGDERGIYDMVDKMEEKMGMVAPTDEDAVNKAQDRHTVPGLRLDQVLALHLHECKRKRPLKAPALERAETVFRSWKETWIEPASSVEI